MGVGGGLVSWVMSFLQALFGVDDLRIYLCSL